MQAETLLATIRDNDERFMRMYCEECSIDGCCDLQEEGAIDDPHCYKSGLYKKLLSILDEFIETLEANTGERTL